MDDSPRFCSQCGAQLTPGSMFCSLCGARVGLAPQAAAPTTQTQPAPGPAAAQPSSVASTPETPAAAAEPQPMPAESLITPPGYAPTPPYPALLPPYPLPRDQSGRARSVGVFICGIIAGLGLCAVVVTGLYFWLFRNPLAEQRLSGRQSQRTAAAEGLAAGMEANSGAAEQTGAAGAGSGGGGEGAAQSGGAQHELPADAPVLDRLDAGTTMAYLVYLLFHEQPWMIADLVDREGCAFAPYGTEAQPPGRNNGEDIAIETEQALIDADATCLGWYSIANGMPDKAVMYWMHLNYDWQRLGLGDQASEFTAFEFFKTDEGWSLEFICPVPDELVPDGSELLPCPTEPPPAD